jgi:hypothetical protein
MSAIGASDSVEQAASAVIVALPILEVAFPIAPQFDPLPHRALVP